MSLLDRLAVSDVADIPKASLLVMAYPGTDPAALALLTDQCADRDIIKHQEDFLLEMAEAWHTMTSFEPLVGHRFSQQQTGPDHPWFGSELTDAAQMATALARGVSLHFGSRDRRMLLVCQKVFWEIRECMALVDFILGWDNDARLLMMQGPQDQSAKALADDLQWRHEVADGAVEAMSVVFSKFDTALGERAMIWECASKGGDVLPDDIAAFVA